MELWYTEPHSKDVKFSIKFDRQLYTEQSDFQRIDVFESEEFGRFLTLDGIMMLTEKDEFIYHEMIVHVPMAVHPNVRKVLVIGAGDGGCLRELTRYPEIEHIDVVEIDERVIAVCREWLPQTACGFDDPRVHIHIADGLKYVRKCVDEYDLIIVDSTDPFGPGEGLFTKEFYGNCFNALRADGIMVNQHESPFYKEDARASVRTSALLTALRFPASIRRTFQLIHPGTGSSALLRKNTILSRIWTQRAGMRADLSPATITPICTMAASICQTMCRICS